MFEALAYMAVMGQPEHALRPPEDTQGRMRTHARAYRQQAAKHIADNLHTRVNGGTSYAEQIQCMAEEPGYHLPHGEAALDTYLLRLTADPYVDATTPSEDTPLWGDATSLTAVMHANNWRIVVHTQHDSSYYHIRRRATTPLAALVCANTASGALVGWRPHNNRLQLDDGSCEHCTLQKPSQDGSAGGRPSCRGHCNGATTVNMASGARAPAAAHVTST
jgi:hypothetical protein